jgi:hypothetical protein
MRQIDPSCKYNWCANYILSFPVQGAAVVAAGRLGANIAQVRACSIR